MGLSDDPRYHDACMPDTAAQVSSNMRDTIDDLRRQLAAANAEIATLKAAFDCSQAQMKALAACDQGPWRGMESAPKDGSTVDLFLGGERLPDAHYDVAREQWLYWWDMDYGEMGWVAVVGVPTHWMPLPEAPKETK